MTNDAAVVEDERVAKIVDDMLTVIRKIQGTSLEQPSELALIAYVVQKNAALREARADLGEASKWLKVCKRQLEEVQRERDEARAERQKYVDAHASVKGGLVEMRKQRDEALLEAAKAAREKLQAWVDQDECDCMMDGGVHSCGLPSLLRVYDQVDAAIAAAKEQRDED